MYVVKRGACFAVLSFPVDCHFRLHHLHHKERANVRRNIRTGLQGIHSFDVLQKSTLGGWTTSTTMGR